VLPYRASEVTGVREFSLATPMLDRPSPTAGYGFGVESCGVCHSDVLAVEGSRTDPSQPVVPGHEIVGVIDAIGAGVTDRH
jgi:propanol-preferring alcohol dehydrogenase